MPKIKTLVMTILAMLFATAATAAPIEESVGVDEGKCEVISAGFWFCKIDGKCYSCGKDKDIDPKRDCFKEEACASVMGQSDLNHVVTRPTRFAMRPSYSVTGHDQAVAASVLCQRTE